MLTSLIKSVFSSLFKSEAENTRNLSLRSSELAEEAMAKVKAGDLAGAEELYRKAIALDPLNVGVISNYGSMLMDSRRIEDATQQFQTALNIDEQFTPALVNLAYVYLETFRSREAEELHQKASQLAAYSPYIDFGLGRTKLFRGEPTAAAKNHLLAWLKKIDERIFAQGYLFNLCYSELATAEKVAAEHGFWAETLLQKPVCTPTTDLPTNKPLRIGYLSPDFREHSVRYFILPLLNNHDKSLFEVYAYSDSSYSDEHTKAVEKAVDHWRNIGHKPDEEAVAIIANDKLDILVELAGHTSGNRIELLANRLARIQITAIGYPPTTGLPSIDYKVVDAMSAPSGTEHYYSEQLLRLPQSFWCFDPGESPEEPTPAPHASNGHITFGCYGNIAKISPAILDCWREILSELPDSQLIVRGITFNDSEARNTILERMKNFKIAVERVQLLPPTRPEQFASAYAEVDIILDTHPFNGGTTTCHALWNGVPVITLTGEILLSRMGASMLNSVGLHDLIADSTSEYIAKAIKLAKDKKRISQLRSTLRARMRSTALGNGGIYARHFEEACLYALSQHSTEAPPPSCNHRLQPIPEKEAVERTQLAFQTGEQAVSERLLAYLQKHYPDNIDAQLLSSWAEELRGNHASAHGILQKIATAPDTEEEIAVTVNLVRLETSMGLYENVLSRVTPQLIAATSPSQRLALSTHLALAKTHLSEKSDEPRNTPAAPEHKLISIIICSIDDVRYERTRTSFAQALQGQKHEFIRINDALSLAEGYNRGIERSSGDLLILSHDDVEILTQDFCHELNYAMSQCEIIGVAGSRKVTGPIWWPDTGLTDARGAVVMPAVNINNSFVLSNFGGINTTVSTEIACLDGLFLAVKRYVFDQIRFDESTFDGFHLYDMDFTFSAYKAGFRLGVAPRLALLHHSVGSYDQNWLPYANAFIEKHHLPTNFKLSPPNQAAGIMLPKLTDAPQVIRHLFSDESTQTAV